MDLRDKRVCIVSYAKYMEKKKFGKIIDSYDVVVRVNNGVNIVDRKYFGTKTDIFSGSFYESKMKMIVTTWRYLNKDETKKTKKMNIYEFLKMIGINYIFINNRNGNSKETEENAIKSGLKIMVDQKINTNIYLTTGLQAIIQLLYLKPKELMVIGFDFTMNFFKDYENFYRMFKSVHSDRLNKSFEEIKGMGHSTIFEKYILKKLWLKYKFNVDPFLKDILNNFDITNLDENTFELSKNRTFIDLFENSIISLIETGKVK